MVAAGLFMTRIAAFLVSMTVARMADVDVFGAFTLFVSVYVLASELPTALDTTFIRFANDPVHERAAGGIVRLLLLTKAGYAALLITTGVLLDDVLASAVFNKPEAARVVRYALVSGGLLSIFYALLAFYQRQRRFRVQAILRPMPNMVVLLGVVIVMAVGYTNIAPIMAVYLAVTAAAALVGVVHLVRSSDSEGNGISVLWADYMRHAAILGGASALNLFLSQIDVFFVAAYLSMADVGMYGVALRVYAILGIIVTVLANLLLPEAPRAIVDRSVLRHYRNVSVLFIGAGVVIMIAMAAFMEQFLGLVFGEGYRGAAFVTNLLLLKVLGAICAVPFQALLQCGVQPSLFLWVVLGRLAVSWVLLTYLVPHYGAVGAAASAALVSWMTVVAMFWMVRRKYL